MWSALRSLVFSTPASSSAPPLDASSSSWSSHALSSAAACHTRCLLLSLTSPVYFIVCEYLPFSLRVTALSQLCRGLPSAHRDVAFLHSAYREAHSVLTPFIARLLSEEQRSSVPSTHLVRSVLPNLHWIQCVRHPSRESVKGQQDMTRFLLSCLCIAAGGTATSQQRLFRLPRLHTLCVAFTLPNTDLVVSFCLSAPSTCPSLSHLVVYRIPSTEDNDLRSPCLSARVCRALSTWPSLCRVTVCDVVLNSSGLAALCQLPQLTHLCVDTCRLEDEDHATLHDQPPIRLSSTCVQLLLPETVSRSRVTIESLMQPLTADAHEVNKQEQPPSLNHLLYQGPITSSMLQRMAVLTSLTALDLSKCRDWSATADLCALLVPVTEGDPAARHDTDSSPAFSSPPTYRPYRPALPHLRLFASWRVNRPPTNAAPSSIPTTSTTASSAGSVSSSSFSSTVTSLSDGSMTGVAEVVLDFVRTYGPQLTCLQLCVPEERECWQPVLSVALRGQRLKSLTLIGYKQQRQQQQRRDGGHLQQRSVWDVIYPTQDTTTSAELHTLALSCLDEMNTAVVHAVVQRCSRWLVDVNLVSLPLLSPLDLIESIAAT